MNYVFHPSAEAEYLESIAYYELKRPGLGASYLAEFERVLVHVCQSQVLENRSLKISSLQEKAREGNGEALLGLSGMGGLRDSEAHPWFLKK